MDGRTLLCPDPVGHYIYASWHGDLLLPVEGRKYDILVVST